MKFSIIEKLRGVLAAGTDRVEKFEIPIMLAPNKNGICVDMEGFRDSKKVQAQLKAAAKIYELMKGVSDEVRTTI